MVNHLNYGRMMKWINICRFFIWLVFASCFGLGLFVCCCCFGGEAVHFITDTWKHSQSKTFSFQCKSLGCAFSRDCLHWDHIKCQCWEGERLSVFICVELYSEHTMYNSSQQLNYFFFCFSKLFIACAFSQFFKIVFLDHASFFFFFFFLFLGQGDLVCNMW